MFVGEGNIVAALHAERGHAGARGRGQGREAGGGPRNLSHRALYQVRQGQLWNYILR